MVSLFFLKKIIVFWCIFIVYASINGVIQGIGSLTESLFFIVNLGTFSKVFLHL